MQQAHVSPLTLFSHCMIVNAQHAMPMQQAVTVYREVLRTDLTLGEEHVQRILDESYAWLC